MYCRKRNTVFDLPRSVTDTFLPESIEDYFSTGYDYRWNNLRDQGFAVLHDYIAMVRCIARKKKILSENVIPIQRHWYSSTTSAKAFCWALNLYSYKDREIAIWGLGQTAKKLYQIMQSGNVPIEAIAGFFQTQPIAVDFLGNPILKIKALNSYRIKVLIIASLDYEDEIYESISWVEECGIKIIRLSKHKRYLL